MIVTNKQYHKFITLQKEMNLLFEEIKRNKAKQLTTIAEVVNVASLMTDLPVDDLMSKNKTMEIVRVRSIIMYFCYVDLDYTYRELGDFFGKTHATILYAVNKFKEDLKLYPEVAEMYKHFKAEIL